jgi:hypothetical protein
MSSDPVTAILADNQTREPKSGNTEKRLRDQYLGGSHQLTANQIADQLLHARPLEGVLFLGNRAGLMAKLQAEN